MERRWICMAAVIALVMTVGLAAPSAHALAGVRPVPGPVARDFDPPDQPWLAGHRGVDLRAPAGSTVVAAAAGRVSFAGIVAGRGVLVVDHGELRTTYEPVSASVAPGDLVGAGQQIGTLQKGHSCPGGECLHWGLKRAEAYLDPLSLLNEAPVRLLPATAAPLVRDVVARRKVTLETGGRLPGLLQRPVSGPIGSRFGPRFHPIFRQWRDHQGIDISAACGTPIRAAGPGRVVHVGYDASGGHRLRIDHGTVGGRRLLTSYLHAQGYRVKVGSRVAAGDLVGTVGNTGWSTGCHLHLATTLDGQQVDPERFL